MGLFAHVMCSGVSGRLGLLGSCFSGFMRLGIWGCVMLVVWRVCAHALLGGE